MNIGSNNIGSGQQLNSNSQSLISKDQKIYVAGHRGMVGSAIMRMI